MPPSKFMVNNIYFPRVPFLLFIRGVVIQGDITYIYIYIYTYIVYRIVIVL